MCPQFTHFSSFLFAKVIFLTGSMLINKEEEEEDDEDDNNGNSSSNNKMTIMNKLIRYTSSTNMDKRP
jgi:hypothetical protein